MVDRIWPRGISKEKAQLTIWMKEIAPSTELRKWYGHMSERFPEFAYRYEMELGNKEMHVSLNQLLLWVKESNVTLLYSAKDEINNQAAVLKGYLDRLS